MNTFEKIMNDDKELLLFASSNMSFSTERKAILFEMLSDPSRTKEDFLYLLEWFHKKNVFRLQNPRSRSFYQVLQVS
jgi:hypothetical protein